MFWCCTETVDGQCVKGAPCPVVVSCRSTVGSMPLFRPAEVGSNPKEGRVAPNIPNPPLFLLVVVLGFLAVVKYKASIPKSARGPGPASRFDVLARRREPWRRRRRRRPATHEELQFLVGGGGGSTSAGHVYRAECSGGFGGGYITTSAA